MNSFSKANPYFAGPILARVGEMYSEVDFRYYFTFALLREKFRFAYKK